LISERDKQPFIFFKMLNARMWLEKQELLTEEWERRRWWKGYYDLF
jgi:hypothetical protein